jgi:DNA ligase 1
LRRFADLFTRLDQTTKTTVKVAALADYFRAAPEDDRLWTVALLSGRRPRRTVTATDLRTWAAERAGLPLWLFEEAYPVVGDLAETIALVLPPPAASSDLPSPTGSPRSAASPASIRRSAGRRSSPHGTRST